MTTEQDLLITKVSKILGSNNILMGNEISERYHVDWSGENPCPPQMVLRPTDTQALSDIVKVCHEQNQKIVIQGGMTGLSGGSTPQGNEVSISMERFNQIEEIDTASMTMTVGAGVLLETIQNAAQDAGFTFPLDLGARGTCTIGGNVATNAGGTQVIRYGMTRALVLGLEAVLPDGTIISSMNKMLKNNAGYDLKHLFIGTEGTLGIITKVILKLFPKMQSRSTALVAASSFDDVVAILQACNTQLMGTLSSFEVMWDNFVDKVVEHQLSGRHPFSDQHPYYILIETEGANQEEDTERLQSVLMDAMENGHAADALIAQSVKEAQDFWTIRDGNAEIHMMMSPLANFDIGLPISTMEQFLNDVERELNKTLENISIVVFGHLGDGNLHVKVSSGYKEDIPSIYKIVYEIVGQHEGSVTAEHGIGLLKLPYLPHSRNETEIDLMHLLKRTIDPKGILNAGRVMGQKEG